jgi:hypothetical protein
MAISSREIAHMQVGQCGNQEAHAEDLCRYRAARAIAARKNLPQCRLAVFFFLLRYTFAEQGRRRPTPRFFSAGAGGVAVETETCVGAAA